MFKNGEKCMIRQRGKEKIICAIAPHIPCGIVTPDQLINLGTVAQKHSVPAIKITSAARIALVGITGNQVSPTLIRTELLRNE